MKRKTINKFYWVARDVDGTLCAFISKPYEKQGFWFPSNEDVRYYYIIPRLYSDIFKDLTFDESPKLVVIKKH